MKIGIYDPYLDDCGGGEKYMMTIADCLKDSHSVDIFWNDESDFMRVKERFGLDLKGVSVVPNVFNYSLLAKLGGTRKYDAIIYLSDGSIPLVASGKLFLHIQRPIKNFGKDLKSKLKLKKIKRVFVNSQFTKRYIDKESGLDSKIIYPPINLKPKNLTKKNVILHVGRFRMSDKTVLGVRDFKKQYIMVDTFKNIYKKLPPGWEFILAVSVNKEDENDFKELVGKAEGYPIKFVINKTNDEIWDLYSSAKIYWHASGYGEDLINHPELAEHFGISTVEAMGAGCVPVVINAGGQKEIVSDNENGLLWNSLSEFEDKTVMIAEDENLLDKLSKRAIGRAQDFSEDKFCREISGLLKE